MRLQLLLSPQGFVGLFLSQPEKEAREDRVVILGFFSLLQSCSMLRAMGGGGQKEGSAEVKQCKTTISDALLPPSSYHLLNAALGDLLLCWTKLK